MSQESTLLYLAIHGAHHLFFRLFWLRDVAEVLRRWEPDHERVASLARQMGAERMLGVSLRLAAHYFGTAIPRVYREMLDENRPVLDQLEERCHRAILDPRFYGRRNRLNVLRFAMQIKPGWQHKWSTISSVYHRWHIRRYLAR